MSPVFQYLALSEAATNVSSSQCLQIISVSPPEQLIHGPFYRGLVRGILENVGNEGEVDHLF